MGKFRHPVPWIIAVTFAVTGIQFGMWLIFKKVGWNGPAQVIHPPSS